MFLLFLLDIIMFWENPSFEAFPPAQHISLFFFFIIGFHHEVTCFSYTNVAKVS